VDSARRAGACSADTENAETHGAGIVSRSQALHGSSRVPYLPPPLLSPSRPLAPGPSQEKVLEMSQSILDSILHSITPDMTSRAASFLGESPSAASSALGAAVPSILAGLLDKSGDPAALRGVLDLIRDPANDGSLVRDAGSLVGVLGGGSSLGDLATRLLTVLFGNRSNAVADTIAHASGVQRSSAGSLLAMAAPLVLNSLGNRLRSESLGGAGLASLLGADRDRILAAAPPGLAAALGLPSLRNLGAAAATRAADRTVAAAAPARSGRWWVPLAIGAALLLGLWALLDRANPPTRPTVAEAPKTAPLPAVAAPPPAAATFRRTLPSGYVIAVADNGVERQLIGFLDDPNRPIDETTWFDFDRLTFETGSATLKPESKVQLRDVAEILKAYPSASVKIGGYTDNTGDPAANLELSRARATSVVNELIALGIPAERLAAEGYGETNPVASNDTDSGRSQNRRIALRVTAR
jgi:outer membrane protein OmpA-like peptidoglycan-associated protein